LRVDVEAEDRTMRGLLEALGRAFAVATAGLGTEERR
jgi:hypothetical protein